MSETDQCPTCGGDCPMTDCRECHGCENLPGGCTTCNRRDTEYECDICTEGGDECDSCDGSGDESYDGAGDCMSCGGRGWRIPEHCCLCGGSPYCDCCPRCKQCVATCRCPVTVRREDGTVQTL